VRDRETFGCTEAVPGWAIERRCNVFPIKEVSGLDVAFGPSDITDMMPPYADIPNEFTRFTNPWHGLVADWFFQGLDKLELTPREGVDRTLAMKHIRSVMGSFAPKHEHKEAGVAFLLSEWFEKAEWQVKGTPEVKTAP
jgi:hypothetical protein